MISVNPEERKHILSEEALIIRHSGEIPEVAYHNSLYHLTADPEGPGMELSPEELSLLKQAVTERYEWIIMRDINPENRNRRIYRGLERCAINWYRLKAFCKKEGFRINDIRKRVAASLKKFLAREMDDIKSGKRQNTSINCSYYTLVRLAEDMAMSEDDLPKGIKDLCSERTD